MRESKEAISILHKSCCSKDVHFRFPAVCGIPVFQPGHHGCGIAVGLAAVEYLPPILTVIYAHEALGRQKMNSKPITNLPVPKP